MHECNLTDFIVQTVAYLLAQKLLAPSKFYLLRGNHELRSVQNMYQFHTYVDYCYAVFLRLRLHGSSWPLVVLLLLLLLRQGGYVFTLLVCLLAGLRKIWWKGHGPQKNPSDFGGNPDHTQQYCVRVKWGQVIPCNSGCVCLAFV